MKAYPTKEHKSIFHQQLADRIESLPEVESAAVISVLPLGGDHEIWSFSIEGRPVEDTANASTMVRHISPGYLQNMRIPMLNSKGVPSQISTAPTARV